jgi:hypothetical protein
LPELKETRICLYGKVKIFKSGGYIRLTPDSYKPKDGYNHIYVNNNKNFPDLDPNQKYTVCIYESYQKQRGGPDGVFLRELISVDKDANNLYDSSVCQDHLIEMTRVLARIEAVGDTDYKIAEASSIHFPNNGVIYAYDNSAFVCRRISWQCTSCVANEVEWKRRKGNQDLYPKHYYFWEPNKDFYSRADYQIK